MAQIRAFFPSRVDSWLVAIGPLAALTAATAVAGLAGPFVLNSGSTPPMLALLAVIVALTLLLLLPLWLVLDTNYTLTADDLLIRSGPFRWRIVLGDVREVSPSHSWISSPALSLDRLSIRYGADRSILVSPREKQRFIDALRQRCPSVLVTGY